MLYQSVTGQSVKNLLASPVFGLVKWQIASLFSLEVGYLSSNSQGIDVNGRFSVLLI
jgi:hypothetical protein